MTDTAYKAPPEMRVGHVHLRVSDLPRAVAFYTDVLGFELQQTFGTSAAFLSAGGYHHHLALNTWGSLGGDRPAKGTTGLFRVAFLYPDRPALARALKRVLEAGVTLDGAADHGVSEAVYFEDPDGNGIELYWDRAQGDWPRNTEGALDMGNAPLAIPALLAEA